MRLKVSVPRAARGAFVAALPLLVGTWALAGVYLSLGPSLAAQLLHSKNLVWGGVLIFLLTGLGALASAVLAKRDPFTVMLGGCLALAVGAVVTLASIQTRTAIRWCPREPQRSMCARRPSPRCCRLERAHLVREARE